MKQQYLFPVSKDIEGWSEIEPDYEDDNELFQETIRLIRNGFSVIPARKDKTPALPSWKEYQANIMEESQVRGFFQNISCLGVICGAVSGNLECIDFDAPELVKPFIDLLMEKDLKLAINLVKRKTPSGGQHLIYRCEDAVDGNQKLAMSADGKETLIETRGEGGYFLTSPSPGYEVLEEHELMCVSTISAKERELLICIARSFSEYKVQTTEKISWFNINGDRPGEKYNQLATRETWKTLLEPLGWTFTNKFGAGGEYLTRPGKKSGTSATLKNNVLYVFSSNADLPLGPNSPFGVYAYLKHNGDFSAAARMISLEMGNDGIVQERKIEQLDSWTEPLPLIKTITPTPYPIDSLPVPVREAVKEVQTFTQAPLALVASSALGALSIAVQGQVYVERARRLVSPASLFLLTIADSGERKSTCDNFFTEVIKRFQTEQAEKNAPLIADHKANTAAWKAKKTALLEKVRQCEKDGEETGEVRRKVCELERNKPHIIKNPRFLLGDETPESLAWTLAKEWPSGAVVSSEASVVLGSHGMGRDSILRNLGLLNILWDGGELSIGRKASESFVVKRVCLTIALQVQKATLMEFIERSGRLVRDIGFLARFLISWPESTQGTRLFIEPPENWAALDKFNERVMEILNEPLRINGENELDLQKLTLSQGAYEKWIGFHDSIETQLKEGEKLFDIRDVASKIADNAARIAAIFHTIEVGIYGEITEQNMNAAIGVACWHLNESHRFLVNLGSSQEVVDTILLEEWLLRRCRDNNQDYVSMREIQQFGPNKVRKKAKLDIVLTELKNRYRVQEIQKEGRKVLVLHPDLLKEFLSYSDSELRMI